MTFSLKELALAGAFAALSPMIGSADIALPDPAFAPEGISADAEGNLYVGSLLQGRLVKINGRTHDVTDFVAAGVNGMVTIVGVHVAGEIVYACSSDPGLGELTGTAAPAIVAFDVKTGEPIGRYELPDGGIFCNDITALPDGTLLATDSFVPRIYVLKPGADALEIWFEDDQFTGEGFNLNGIAYDDGNVYVAKYNAGTLHSIPVGADGTAGEATQITLPNAVHGADGLNALGGGRFLLVEGGGLTDGVRGSLIGLTLKDGVATLDTIAPDLNVPTTATVVDGVAYVVEGQLDNLFDPTAGEPDLFKILEIELPTAYK
jgi:hypothetical protein